MMTGIHPIQQIKLNMFYRPPQAEMTIDQFKNERHKRQLAVFDGSKLVFLIWNGKFVILQTQISRVEAFLKNSNYELKEVVDALKIPLDMKLYHGLLIVIYRHHICLIDFQSMTLLQSLSMDTIIDLNPIV